MSESDITWYRNDLLDVIYAENVIDEKECEKLISELNKLLWYKGKKTTRFFGDEGIVYKNIFGEKEYIRKVEHWNTIKNLIKIKEKVEDFTKLKFTVAAIQYYHDGNIGISKHRDKEVGKDEFIVGLSLGETRLFRLTKNENKLDLYLKNRSLYIVDGITNKYWTHEIVKNKNIKNYRFSLTFRNYKNK